MGGAPSILPEFDQTVKWLCDNNYYQYIHTNAIKLSPAIGEILTLDRGKINVSLDSGGARVYSSIKGVEKFDRVIQNIGQYARMNPNNIELKYIIYEKNNDIAEMREFIALANNMGIKKLQFSFDFREQNKGIVSDKSLAAAAFLFMGAAGVDINVVPF